MTIDMKHILQPGADFKIISSGANHRSTSIVSGYKISAPIPIIPATTNESMGNASPFHRLEDDIKRSSRYPIIPGLPLKPKLRRQRHVRKHSNEEEEEPEETIVVAPSSPVLMTPDQETFSMTPTQDKPEASPATPAWARPSQRQRYPSIFEDYYDDPGSAKESPIHSIEEIAAEKEHDAWGKYWNDKMDGHVSPEDKRPVVKRADTLEVTQLLRSRRLHAADYRQDSLASLREED